MVSATLYLMYFEELFMRKHLHGKLEYEFSLSESQTWSREEFFSCDILDYPHLT